MTPIVADSWAVIAHLGEDSQGDRVEMLLSEWHDSGRAVLITAVNFGEVRYYLRRRVGAHAAESTASIIRAMGIELVPVDEVLAAEAADLKADTPVAFADCFAAALARLRDAEVATGDPEFRKFGDRVKVLWLGSQG